MPDGLGFVSKSADKNVKFWDYELVQGVLRCFACIGTFGGKKAIPMNKKLKETIAKIKQVSREVFTLLLVQVRRSNSCNAH